MAVAWTNGRIGLALILAGCAPAPAATPLVHLDLADGFVACDGETAYIEAFAREVFEELEQPVPDDLALTLHIVGPEEFERLGLCGPDAGGCAHRGEAWTVGSGSDTHEVTHMIMRELSPWALAPLAEGIAESLGTPSPYWPESTPRPPLASYATKSEYELSNSEWVGAGLYSTFLLDEFGPQAYLDLYRSLPLGSSLEEVDDRMREHLGASLADIDARFADPVEARCMLALAFCGDVLGPPLEPPFEIEQSLACDEPGTLGFAAEDGSRRPIRHWQVFLPRDGTYWVEAEGTFIYGLHCGPCEERAASIPFNGTVLMEGRDVELEAGLYVFEVNQLLDGHETFRLAIREHEV